MTETTQTTSPLRTEASLLRTALRAVRDDLLTGVFAFRPVEPLTVKGDGASRLLRRIPEEARPYARWLPHGVVVAVAALIFVFGLSAVPSFAEGTLIGLLAVVPVLLTLFRPVAAFWLSLALTAIALPLVGDGPAFPWTTCGAMAHIVVMAQVALRSRPRVAVQMWLITMAFCAAVAVLSRSVQPAMLVMGLLGALTLAAAASVRGWSAARREVVAKEEVTLVERSLRTRLEERTTIARELHDVVAHHMSVVAIQAEAAPYRVENPPEELTQAFATIRENAVAALTELRRVLGVVRAEDYEAPDAPQPTLADLDALLGNVRATGLTVDKTVTGAVRTLPQGVELSAYRIVQEALSNALRHAPGATAHVEVAYVLGGLGLRILNGPPSAYAKAPARTMGAGHGLTGMRERVAMLDGEMTTGPDGDGGYEVAVFLPVRSVEEAA